MLVSKGLVRTTCKNCGKQVIGEVGSRRFCSDACEQTDNRAYARLCTIELGKPVEKPAKSNIESCNRHADCSKKRPGSECCHDSCCEECFGY
jgi:hypothetical protein